MKLSYRFDDALLMATRLHAKTVQPVLHLLLPKELTD